VNALTPIHEFNDYFSAELEDEDCDTVGGLILQRLEHFPKKGEKVEIDDFGFEVLRADNRRVHLLKLRSRSV
jgi:magnesium and cobalt transporter